MGHRGIYRAPAFPTLTDPITRVGAEGEMARVSIASLLEGGGLPIGVASDGGGENLVGVGRHGMIADLYSSASLSSAMAGDLALQGVFGTASVGGAHVPADLLRGEADSAGSGVMSLGIADGQRVPGDAHAAIASQSALGSFAAPMVPASLDDFAVSGAFALGHHEGEVFLGSDGLPAPISEHHFIA